MFINATFYEEENYDTNIKFNLCRLARDLRLPAGLAQPLSKPDVRENAAPSYKSVSQKDDDEGGSGGGLC